jgi:hypothetical protein
MDGRPSSAAEPIFTAEGAGAMLPELRERLLRIRRARQVMLRTAEPIGRRAAARGPTRMVAGPADDRERLASESLGAEIAWLAERNILLRDPETGLVDFPSERDHRRVFLCWRLGEEIVAFWHGTDVGCSGRRRL